MQSLSYSILIIAPKDKVWQVMLADNSYRQWTKAFHEGSFFEGDWSEGSEMRFLGPGEDGKFHGMFSRIKENRLYDFISIEHLGMIHDGVIDTTSDEVKKWSPSFENYTFKSNGDRTELKIDMQAPAEYKEMFDESWPKALKVLKELSEK